jgi:hypothetical protein
VLDGYVPALCEDAKMLKQLKRQNELCLFSLTFDEKHDQSGSGSGNSGSGNGNSERRQSRARSRSGSLFVEQSGKNRELHHFCVCDDGGDEDVDGTMLQQWVNAVVLSQHAVAAAEVSVVTLASVNHYLSCNHARFCQSLLVLQSRSLLPICFV